jgi:hypothetical protein
VRKGKEKDRKIRERGKRLIKKQNGKHNGRICANARENKGGEGA